MRWHTIMRLLCSLYDESSRYGSKTNRDGGLIMWKRISSRGRTACIKKSLDYSVLGSSIFDFMSKKPKTYNERKITVQWPISLTFYLTSEYKWNGPTTNNSTNMNTRMFEQAGSNILNTRSKPVQILRFWLDTSDSCKLKCYEKTGCFVYNWPKQWRQRYHRCYAQVLSQGDKFAYSKRDKDPRNIFTV